ncbi:MAG: sugar transferase [Anaerolineales bacterium]|nr:sugar transferase [Anaerolineales bacterium]
MTKSLQTQQLFLKRIFDLVVAALLLIVLAPAFLLIAVAIRVTSGSPVLYEWRVIGQGGQPFIGHKFRTMIVDADRMKNDLLHRNEMNGGPVFKIKDDPRVTRIGKFLRKFSLDELPQLWSVLKGDMSLVGPRPPLASEYAHFEEWQKRKLIVKPGMTCLWQVRGKPTDWREWLQLDFEYIDHWSLWLDFKILWQTFIVVITGKNS